MRKDGRALDQLREVVVESGVNPYAEGSTRISYGNTVVMVTASLESKTPSWMQPGMGGWITAEYGMLPRATHTRNSREAASGKQGGRTLEIQRLVGRSLRQAVDVKELEGVTIRVDCDVLVADGGTRTASITAGWIALYQAIEKAKKGGLVASSVKVKPICAVSVGSVDQEFMLDLAYVEDSNADFDLNLVFDESLAVVEIQGTAEKRALTRKELGSLLDLGELGASELFALQKKAVGI